MRLSLEGAALRKIRSIYILLGCTTAFVSSLSIAECVALVKGPVVYDVTSCKQISVPKDLDLQDENFREVKGLDARNKAKLYVTYKGMLLKGTVVKSSAIQSGLGFKGALKGETVDVFLAPGAGTCQSVQGKRLAAEVDQACCDGASEAPCMLNTSYFFKKVKPIGKAGSSAGDKKRKAVEKISDYRDAAKLFKEKKYKRAAKSFESLRKENNLDVRGHYLLAVSYHKQEQCKKAIEPLEYVYKKSESKKVWADQEKIARRATFLLAKCYARLNVAGKAVIILNSYLIEPSKYKFEISKSLKAYEFGFIHTSKDYRSYKARAQKFVKTDDYEE